MAYDIDVVPILSFIYSSLARVFFFTAVVLFFLSNIHNYTLIKTKQPFYDITSLFINRFYCKFQHLSKRYKRVGSPENIYPMMPMNCETNILLELYMHIFLGMLKVEILKYFDFNKLDLALEIILSFQHGLPAEGRELHPQVV